MPLDERLKRCYIDKLTLIDINRFAAKSGQESAPQIFCSEKQESDKLLRQGKALKPPPANIKENPYYDPMFEAELKRLKHEHKQTLQQREKKVKKKLLREALRTIPKVDYHPDAMIIDNARAAEASHFSCEGFAETPLVTEEAKEEIADDVVEMINAGQFKNDDDLFEYFMKSKVTVVNKGTKKVETPLPLDEPMDYDECGQGDKEEFDEECYDDARLGAYEEEED